MKTKEERLKDKQDRKANRQSILAILKEFQGKHIEDNLTPKQQARLLRALCDYLGFSKLGIIQ